MITISKLTPEQIAGLRRAGEEINARFIELRDSMAKAVEGLRPLAEAMAKMDPNDPATKRYRNKI